MRLSKTSWFILGLGIFIIAFASLSVARGKQILVENELNDKLTVAQKRVNTLKFDQLYTQQEEIEKQLGEATSQLETAKARLSRPTQSIIASSNLFSIAQRSGVEIMEINSPGLNKKDILEDVGCSTLPISIRVEGDVLAIITFTTNLNNDFDIGVVKSVRMDIPEEVEDSSEVEGGLEGETEEEEVAEKPSANIFLVIYMYQGE